MIHFTCYCCNQPIDVERDIRYTVRMEVYPAFEGDDSAVDDERDHLQEIEDILEQIEQLDGDELTDEMYHQVRYDLCSDCYKLFKKNPLSRLSAMKIGFGNN